MNWIERLKYEWNKNWNHESPIIKKDCNHIILQKFPKGLYCCKECRRTFQIHLFMSEVKLNKIEFSELEALMT
jgi:hypothetical protein